MSIYSTYSDQQLASLLRENDEAAFEQVYIRFKDKLFFYILRLTESTQKTEDILQDVFIKLWLNRSAIIPTQNLSAWIYTFARNLVFDEMRRAAKELAILEQLKGYTLDAHDSSEHKLLCDDLRNFVNTTVEKLPHQQKLVFSLSRERGLMHAEIADQLNISPKTVRKHLQQALRFIRDRYAAHYKYIPPVVLVFCLL